jgi:hypothetical protein
MKKEKEKEQDPTSCWIKKKQDQIPNPIVL